MDLVEILREQASKLRSLAKSSEASTIRARILELSRWCEDLADETEREISERWTLAEGWSPRFGTAH